MRRSHVQLLKALSRLLSYFAEVSSIDQATAMDRRDDGQRLIVTAGGHEGFPHFAQAPTDSMGLRCRRQAGKGETGSSSQERRTLILSTNSQAGTRRRCFNRREDALRIIGLS